MEAMTIVYMILGAIVFTDFVSSFFCQEEVYTAMFWETNLWVYSAYKLGFVLLVLIYFIELRKAEKLKSE